MKKFKIGDLVQITLPDDEDIRHNSVGKVLKSYSNGVVYEVIINKYASKIHRCFLRKVSKDTDPELFL